ncbi:MAG: TetR/AcrR family transcriptional regulator [Gemmatimonadota bacterium]
MTKAEQTRAAIVDAALAMAQQIGLEGLTIGSVADESGLSKSGVFSRVGSREELQVAALKEYERRFVEQVMTPALREPRGLARLRATWQRWLEWVRSGLGGRGCLFVSGATEYDDRPGAVRDALLTGLAELRKQLARMIRQAIDLGELALDTDPEQVAFELYAIVLALHNEDRLFRDRDAYARAQAAFERVVASCDPAPRMDGRGARSP